MATLMQVTMVNGDVYTLKSEKDFDEAVSDLLPTEEEGTFCKISSEVVINVMNIIAISQVSTDKAVSGVVGSIMKTKRWQRSS